MDRFEIGHVVMVYARSLKFVDEIGQVVAHSETREDYGVMLLRYKEPGMVINPIRFFHPESVRSATNSEIETARSSWESRFSIPFPY